MLKGPLMQGRSMQGRFAGPAHSASRTQCASSRTHATLQEFRRKNRMLGDAPREPVPTKLRLFLDSASITQHELWLSTGLFHGVTTNPTILQRDNVRCTVRTLTGLAKSAFDMGAQEVHLQAWGASVQKLSSIAFDLAGIDPARIVVKLPCTLEGTQTAALLRESNIRVTLTGLYAANQVLVGQAVGAEYAAPYLGRMNDAYGGDNGTAQVLEMQKIIDSCHSRMRLMVASIRDTQDMVRLSAQGCNTFTISPTVSAKLFNNAYTIDAVDEFEKAAKANGADEDLARASVRDLSSAAAAASREEPHK